MALFSEQLLVLDVGSWSVRGILYEKSPSGSVVIRTAERILDYEDEFEATGEVEEDAGTSEEEQAPSDSSEETGSDHPILSFIHDYFPDQKNFVISLPSSSVFLRNLDLPIVDERQVKQVLVHEMEGLLPIPVESAEVVGQVWSQFEEESSILCYTASKEEIINRVRPFLELDHSSLRLLTVNSSAIAAATALLDEEATKDRTIAQLHIGHTRTILNLVHDGKLAFSRTLLFGGRDITGMIRDACKTDFTEAESLKLDASFFVALPDEKLSKLEPGLKPEGISLKDYTKLLEKIRDAYQELSSEIERSFLSWESLNPDVIYLSGGGSLFSGTTPFLEARLERPVLDYPLAIDGEGVIAPWVEAIGIFEEYKKKPARRVDFLDTHTGRLLKKGEFHLSTFSTPLIIAGIGLVFLLISSVMSMVQDRKTIAGYRSEIAAVSKKIPGFQGKTDDPVSELEKLCKERLASYRMQNSAAGVLEVLLSVSEVSPAPEDVKFTLKNFQFSEKEVEIEAEVGKLTEVTVLQEAYEKSSLFNRVEVKSDTIRNGLVRVRIKLELKDPGQSLGVDCR